MAWRSYVGLCPNVWQVQHSWGRRRCKTGDVCKELPPDGYHKESTVFQPDIACSADWVWTKRQYLADLPERPSTIAERFQKLTNCGCKSECHGWCEWHRFGLACTSLCSCRCEVESHCQGNYYQGWRYDLVIWLKMLCSLLHYSILLPSSCFFKYMSSLCYFCLRSRLHFMLTNMMYFNSLSNIL